MAKAKVYILNKSSHDFSHAKTFGELVFVTEGLVDRFAVNSLHREIKELIDKSNPDDLIVPCSLAILNILTTSMFSHKHGRLNLLLYHSRKKQYLERNLVF